MDETLNVTALTGADGAAPSAETAAGGAVGTGGAEAVGVNGTVGGITPESGEAGAVVDIWRRDATLLSAEYPGFDLAAEMKNAKFRHYLLGGDSIRTAYENLHRAEIMEAYGRKAEAEAEARLSNMIAAGARFPREGAVSSNSSGRTKSGVGHLSKRERADMIRRAASGERIVL